MGFGFLIAGMIFLFDPFINIFDILPDAIGYMLIVYGLSKMADLELKVAEARRRMTHALAVAAGKLATVLLSFVMEFDATLVLVFAFSFATLEIFFVLPAFTMLFESLEYSCMRFSEKMITNKAENLLKFTPIFIIVRALAAVLPQLTELVKQDPNINSETGLEGSGVIYVMLTVMCAVISLVFGIIWLSMVMPYLKSLKADKAMQEHFLERYKNEVLTDEVLHIKRSIKRFTALLFATLFLYVCVPLDDYYMMPEFLAPVLLLLGFFFAKRYTAEYKRTLSLCILAAAVSLAAYCLLFRYSSEMGYVYFPYKAKGFWGYFAPYAVCAAIYYPLFFFVYKRAFAALKTMVESCMGLHGTSDARRIEADNYRKQELCTKVKRLSFLTFATVGASLLFMLLAPWFELAWTARLIFAVVTIVYAYNLKSDIYEETERIL